MRTGHYKEATITALGHAGFLVSFEPQPLVLVFDPYEAKTEQQADVIFISHAHYDHCDPNSIRRLMKNTTVIVAPRHCQNELSDIEASKVWVEDNDFSDLPSQLKVKVIPAYNTNKFRTPTEQFHPKSLGGVGYLVSYNEKMTLFHAGDTDFTPEMNDLAKKIDVAFLPISGTYVMTLQEAIEASKILQPKLAVPMHYGKLLGSVAEAFRFQNLLQGIVPVAVLCADHE